MQTVIPLSNGRSLIAGHSRAGRTSRLWAVYLPESGAGFHSGSRKEINQLLGPSLASGFHYLVINKNGVGPRGVDRKAFEPSFRRHLRVQDALATMARLIPAGHKIFLIGYSEGAYLAPQIARLDGRVKAMVMIGGGTRGWLKEELSNAEGRGKAALLRQIREIEANPRPDQKWQGFSYATWHSYRHDSTLAALNRLRIPSLAILGSQDRTIDLRATLDDLYELSNRRPVETRVIPRCGHSFAGHWPEAHAEIRAFLRSLPEL